MVRDEAAVVLRRCLVVPSGPLGGLRRSALGHGWEPTRTLKNKWGRCLNEYQYMNAFNDLHRDSYNCYILHRNSPERHPLQPTGPRPWPTLELATNRGCRLSRALKRTWTLPWEIRRGRIVPCICPRISGLPPLLDDLNLRRLRNVHWTRT